MLGAWVDDLWFRVHNGMFTGILCFSDDKNTYFCPLVTSTKFFYLTFYHGLRSHPRKHAGMGQYRASTGPMLPASARYWPIMACLRVCTEYTRNGCAQNPPDAVPVNMPELDRFWADAGSIGPVLAHDGMFTGLRLSAVMHFTDKRCFIPFLYVK